ncbi:MAG: glycosyltransferase [Prevotellaceae bacterium]|jgi:glycosyltransferase involved in cell wall biosynthesis|nr:glycosyltransferase [Prevotellaceae bacterium]
MQNKIQFSIVVPVFNRPYEIEEFLESLSQQTDNDFEVIIMEGASTQPCDEICKEYSKVLDIKHTKNQITSRSIRRNIGIENAAGNYVILFDSDCILPPQYIATIRKQLTENYADCFGGPDNAHESFNKLQKAINYSMTSLFTTGGIRGATSKTDKFLPRAFNMGFSKEVYAKTGGYDEIIGEDIDLSMRIKEAGFSVRLIKDAFVYHKRRLTLKKFYKQTYTFGRARIVFGKRHKGTLKILHLLPTCFVLGNIFLVSASIISGCAWLLLPILFYIITIFIDSLMKNKNLSISLLSILTSYIQLFGYGLGLLDELITRRVLNKSAEKMYRQ